MLQIGTTLEIGHFYDSVIYYNYQNPFRVCCFLLQIRDIILVREVKKRHREQSLIDIAKGWGGGGDFGQDCGLRPIP